MKTVLCLALTMLPLQVSPLASQEAFLVPLVVKPLPPIQTLLGEMKAKHQAEKPRVEAYTYTEKTHQVLKNASGKVTEEELVEREVTTINGRTLSRLVAKNGKPLNEKEAAKENARLEKAALEASVADPKALGSDMLMDGDFSNLRREDHLGRNLLLLDFRGKPNPTMNAMNAKLARSLAGTLYVDESTRDMVRFDGKLTESMKLGLGLLGAIDAGTRFTFETVRVQGEVSMPSRISITGSGRFLVMRGAMDVEITFSAFKKFDMGSSTLADTQILAKQTLAHSDKGDH